jgi:hypothetical protein
VPSKDEILVQPRLMRNGLIGVGASFVILTLALVFFSDAGEPVLGAIGMFAFFFALAVTHVLDEVDRRHGRLD